MEDRIWMTFSKEASQADRRIFLVSGTNRKTGKRQDYGNVYGKFAVFRRKSVRIRIPYDYTFLQLLDMANVRKNAAARNRRKTKESKKFAGICDW